MGVEYGDCPEAETDRITDEWEAGEAERRVVNNYIDAKERMRRSLFEPALGGNVPKPNLFEQWRASGSVATFAEWCETEGV